MVNLIRDSFSEKVFWYRCLASGSHATNYISPFILNLDPHVQFPTVGTEGMPTSRQRTTCHVLKTYTARYTCLSHVVVRPHLAYLCENVGWLTSVLLDKFIAFPGIVTKKYDSEATLDISR